METMIPKTILAAAVLLAAPAQAATIFADNDTFVRRGSSEGSGDNSANFDDQNITVKFSNLNSNANRIGFVNFDLSTLAGPITVASLQLTTVTAPDRTIRLYGASDTALATLFPGAGGNTDRGFSEGSLSFNSADSTEFNDTTTPQNNVDAAGDPSGLDLLDLGTFNPSSVTAGGVLTYSSPALLLYLEGIRANGLVNATLIFASETQDTSDSFTFEDREGGTGVAPRLELTAVPEPAALALLALGAPLLFRRRR